jgi:glycosyltransferase involved in cell wall biosynthesis
MSSNREVQQIGYDYLVDEGNIKLELENIPDDREFIPDYDASIKIVQTISPLSVNYQENKKILLTNHHLENYAGSELVTFELAKEFQSRGWDVYVATFSYGGNMKELFEKNDISVFNILNESLLTKDFDLVWGHHFPVLYKCFFKDQIKTKNLVLSSLSPYEPLESIVHLHEESNAVIFNSQETYNHHIQYFEKFASKFQVFPNSVGQEYFEKSKNSFNHDIKKIAIVSNHAPPEVMEAIEKLEAKNIEVIFVGQQQKSQLVDSALLMSCDVVITIGRTVQHCMALKVPVFVYDHFGGPGWLNDTNLKEVEWFNYSGRCCRNKLSVDEIIRDIFSGYKSALENLPFFYNYAQEKYNLSNNISNILNRLNFEKQAVIKIKFNHHHRWDNLCRTYYDIYSRSLGNLHYHIAQLQKSQLQLQESQLQLQETQSQLQESQLQLQKSQLQLQESQLQLQETQSQLQESQLQLQESQSQLYHYQVEYQKSQLMIVAMETSKFWMLRKMWFKFKNSFSTKNFFNA